MESSKTDIEKLFLKPKITQKFEKFGIEYVLYQTAEGELAAQYSTGVCAARDPDSESSVAETYKVEKGKIVDLIFFPKKIRKLSEFKIDITKLSKERRGEDPAEHYVDIERGIDHSVALGKVLHVNIYATERAAYLKCLVSRQPDL